MRASPEKDSAANPNGNANVTRSDSAHDAHAAGIDTVIAKDSRMSVLMESLQSLLVEIP
jgi:hypothetical protein